MVNEKVMEKDIEKIFNNGFGKSRSGQGTAGKLLPEQIMVLKEFYNWYKNKPSSKGGRTKPASVWNNLCVLRYLGIFLKKPYKEATKQDLMNWVKSLNDKSISTTSNWKVIIRGFYKWLYNSKTFPEQLEDAILKPENVKTNRTPSMLPTKDEIKQMLNAAITYKQKAIIMLTFGEGSLRGGEIVYNNVEDVEFDARGCKYWVRKSKSRERYVRLIDAEPYIREYLNKEHEHKNIPNYPLFYSEQHGKGYGDRLNVNAVNELLKRVAVKAGIKKRIFTHLGRHTSITALKNLGLDSSILAKRAGITLETLERVYLHSSDKDVDDAYITAKGGEDKEEIERIKKEQEKLQPRICVRCGTTSPATAKYCNCGMVLDQLEAQRLMVENSRAEANITGFLGNEPVQQLFKMMYKLQKQIEEMKGKN